MAGLEKSTTITFQSEDCTVDDADEDEDDDDDELNIARTSTYRSRGSVSSRDSFQSLASCKSHAARKSIVMANFGSESESLLELERYLADQKGACPGFFVDYMERSQAVERRLAARMTPLSGTRRQTRGAKSLTASPNVVDYQSEVQYEHLVDELMYSLIKFWRNEGDVAWAQNPKPLDMFKERVRDIVRGKQKKKATAVEVILYDARYKKKHQRSKGLEHQDERHGRLKDFLKQYHASQSKVDLQMPNSDGRLRLVQSDKEAAHMAFSKSLERKPMAVQTSGVATPPAKGETFSPQKLDSWKIRAARGHGTRSMDLAKQIGRELSQMPEMSQGSPASTLDLTLKLGSSLNLTSPIASCWKSPKYSPSAGGSSTLTGGWGLAQRSSPTPPPLDRESLRADSFRRGSLGPAKQEPRSSSLGAVSRAIGQRPLSGKRPLPLSQSAPTLLGNGSNSLMSPVRQKERSPFVSPWRGSSTAVGTMPPRHALESQTAAPSSVDKYLREAELNYVSPKLIPFITGHSDGLQAKNQALDDTDLLVIGTMLPGKEVITEVDLCGNTLLTEKSLVPFLNKIFDQPVEKLSLNHCLHYATPPGIKETLDVIQRLLRDVDGLKFLKILDLSGIAMAVGTHVPLCHAIQDHPRLTNVSLADTGMSGAVAKQCIRQLTASTSVEVLDLSWNNFNPDVFILLGQRLMTTFTLLSLSIANCSSSQSDLDNPVAYFLEYLSRNPRLTHLDVSVNRITFRGTLVLEDALEAHSKLSDITVSNNPIGVLGMRCLLRLLSRPTSGLIHMNAESVLGGTIKEAETEKMQLFRPSCPGGSYNLNLSRPYHRALLRMLYKSCDRLCLSPDDAFTNVTYSKGNYSHPGKDSDGLYAVLEQGKLQFRFMPVASATSGPLKGIADDEFGEFLNRYADCARLHVGFKKIVPMMAYWNSIDGRVADQVLVLDALCKDFAFTWDQIGQMCKSRPIISDVLTRLMPCVVGGLPGLFMISRLAISMSEYAKVHKTCDSLLEFNCENPTGHYRLSLDNANDFCVAERLILLDRWETQVNRRLERADVSQMGNGSHIRNVKFEENPLRHVYSVVDWSMREWDTFEFDYASSKRPPPGAPIVNLDHWESMLVALQQAGCTQKLQVTAFRKLSHHFYLSSQMLRQLVNLFESKEHRVDVFVDLFFRVTDIWNEKVARVCFDADLDADRLRKRLGYVTFFPFIQPEQASFKFDLSLADERLALYILVLLQVKESAPKPGEKPREYIRDYELKNGDGTKENLIMGLPPGWSTSLDKIPSEGSFKCKYMCAPEDRSILERKKNIEKFGFWPGPNSDEEVDWWSDINPPLVPEDVVEFLEFLVTKYDNVYDAFVEIDGEDGNKNISKDEFMKGLAHMDFRKFSGGGHKGKKKKKSIGGHKAHDDKLVEYTPHSTEYKRIENVFRYLDPSGEGQVSEEEWGVLDQLFKETYHSVREFVWFLNRTFEDLDDAWHALSVRFGKDEEVLDKMAEHEAALKEVTRLKVEQANKPQKDKAPEPAVPEPQSKTPKETRKKSEGGFFPARGAILIRPGEQRTIKTLDFKAWEAASRSVGYHGPTRSIFSYLDKDGEGSVSCEEFQVLANFGKLNQEDD